jgi:Lon-like protease
MWRSTLSPLRLLAAAVVVIIVLVVVAATRKSDNFLEVPDTAHALAGLVQVPGPKARRNGGGIYYVDVLVKKASLLQATFSFLRPEGSDLIPADSFVPCGISYGQELKIERETMKVSQEKASVVALRALGFKVRAREQGVRVFSVDPRSHAHGALVPGDVVVFANGRPIRNRVQLFTVLARARAGDVVTLSVRRGGKLRRLRVRTIADQCDPHHRAIIGFVPFDALDVDLPFRIRFNLGDVGGPSAGLAFALEVLEQKGRDVDRGLKIAATGEIQLDGRVTRIGGVKQKTIGARRAHVSAFLVPVDGDNAEVAKRYAHGLRIVPVKSFQQALQALATLRRNA